MKRALIAVGFGIAALVVLVLVFSGNESDEQESDPRRVVRTTPSKSTPSKSEAPVPPPTSVLNNVTRAPYAISAPPVAGALIANYTLDGAVLGPDGFRITKINQPVGAVQNRVGEAGPGHLLVASGPNDRRPRLLFAGGSDPIIAVHPGLRLTAARDQVVKEMIALDKFTLALRLKTAAGLGASIAQIELEGAGGETDRLFLRLSCYGGNLIGLSQLGEKKAISKLPTNEEEFYATIFQWDGKTGTQRLFTRKSFDKEAADDPVSAIGAETRTFSQYAFGFLNAKPKKDQIELLLLGDMLLYAAILDDSERAAVFNYLLK